MAASFTNLIPVRARLVRSQPEQRAINIYEIDPINDPRWGALVETHSRASVFHSPRWLWALHRAYGYDPIAITTSAPGENLANGLVFCRLKSWLTGRRLISLPFSDHCEPLVDHSDDLDSMLLHLERYIDEGRWKHVEIKPILVQPTRNTMLKLSSTYQFHRVDLRPALEDILRKTHKSSVQRKIRRAEREGLKYEEGTSEEHLEKFYGLLLMTRRRHCLPPQPRFWFQILISSFGDALKFRVVSKNDVPVASIMTLSHKNTIVYKYGCSNAQFNNMGGMVFLLWKTIQEAKLAGFEHLDLGRSDLDNQGLIDFKRHWGATESLLSYWIYPRRDRSSIVPGESSISGRLFSAMPNFILEKTGTLLYRHFG